MSLGSQQIEAAWKAGVMLDSDTMTYHGVPIIYRLTQESGGVYGTTTTTGGAINDTTPYIFTWGDVDWQTGDLFTRRGQAYQIGSVSKTTYEGAVVATQAGVTLVQS